jgi:PIN domain nuclease of toxin-antitoxin system
MNVLLDTHIVLWWMENPEKIDPSASKIISDDSNNVYVSVAALWEII